MAKTIKKTVKKKVAPKPICVLNEVGHILRVYLNKSGISVGGKPRDAKAFCASLSKGSARKLRKALDAAGRRDLVLETLS